MSALTGHEASVVDGVGKQLFIGGKWRDAEGAKTFDVEDPATGQVIAQVADAGVSDGRAALDAAVAVQEDWARTPPRDRGEILRKAWELITQRASDLALLMTLEMGKALPESEAEITYLSLIHI